MTRLFFVIGLLLALGTLAVAADFNGKWTAQVPGREGQTREQTFNFKVEGDKVTGTVSGRQRENPIADGKVSGDTISFTVTAQMGDNTVKQTYTGKASGDTIQFKREGGQGQPREFVAKRAK